MRKLVSLFALIALTACTTIFNLRIPLLEGEGTASMDAPNIVIEDHRPPTELNVHTGTKLLRCERWYGDNTYVPSKLEYLDQLLAARIPNNKIVKIRLLRFDTIEYCENTANAAAAAAAIGATGATGTPVIVTSRAVAGGDSVVVRLAGDINGLPFDLSRRFDYGGLPLKFGEMPSANPTYRDLMRRAIVEIVDEIVAKLPTS